MSYMNDRAAFVADIQELSVDEINHVGGGPGPLAPAGVAAARCMANTTCREGAKATIVAIAGAVAAYFGYENNRV
jgi:hypothetical protein